MKINRVLGVLAVGLFLSLLGVFVGGQTGVLLLAFSGNLLTVGAVYFSTTSKTRRNGTS